VCNYTNACNLSFKHFYKNAQKTAFGELSMAQRKQVVDQLDQERVVSVAFSGGEPPQEQRLF
jgi:MoaA/NifB/PqqE/SkfB family radical SAM enzyme